VAFDGNGNFVRIHNWVSDKTNGIPITSSEVDGEDNGFAAGLTLAVTRDGQGKMAAHFQPSVSATYDLGQNALQWRNLFLSGNANVGGNLAVTGAVSGFAVPQYFQKQVIQTVTNSTTTVQDTALVSPTLGQGTYQFEMMLYLSGTSPGGIRLAPTLSNSFTHSLFATNGVYTGVSNASGAINLYTGGAPAGTPIITGAISNGDWIRAEGFFSKSSNSDVFSLFWAQNTANATGTSLAPGSYMKLTQVSTSFF